MDSKSVTFSVNNNMVTIEVLTGSNFKKWKQDVEFAVEIADVDLAMTTDKPADLIETSTDAQKQTHAAWWKSNRMCYLTMKRSIPEHLLSGLPNTAEAKEFLTAVSQRYKVSSNAEIGTLLRELYSMRYDGVGGVREYIIKMVHYQTKLQALNISLPDACIVHQALNTLPTDFGLLVTTYNSQDEAWGINDLITKCVAEEEKLRSEKSQAALLVSKPSGTGQGKKAKFPTPKNVQNTNSGQSSTVGVNKVTFKKDRCHFCKKKGHFKANCLKYKTWLEKRENKGVRKQEEAK